MTSNQRHKTRPSSPSLVVPDRFPQEYVRWDDLNRFQVRRLTIDVRKASRPAYFDSYGFMREDAKAFVTFAERTWLHAHDELCFKYTLTQSAGMERCSMLEVIDSYLNVNLMLVKFNHFTLYW